MAELFANDDKQTRIIATFMANADSDAYKELIDITACDRKDKDANGTAYTVKVYDNIFPNIYPARLNAWMMWLPGWKVDLNGC